MKKIKLTGIISFALLLICACVAFAACKKSGGADGGGYTVTFYLYGDNSFNAKCDARSGKVAKPEEPEREGYTFDGWYVSEKYDCVFDFDAALDGDTALYAKWSKNLNRIRFESNGGVGAMEEIQAETDTVIKLPLSGFGRTGYVFAGWSDTAGGVVKNKDGGWFYMESEAVVTLFACWKPQEFTVTLNNGDGASDASDVTALYDAALPQTAAPKKAGYVFAGYFTEEYGGGEKYYDASMQGCRKYLRTESVTLYACWTEADNSVRFDGNGGAQGFTAAIGAKTNSLIVLPENGYSRTGYVFDGWSTLAAAGGERYAAGESYILPAKDGQIVLYALWKPVCYTVVLDDNFSGDSATLSLLYDEPQVLPANGFTRYGYSFIAWNDSPDGAGSYYGDKQQVVNLCREEGAALRLYAVWSPATVEVVFDRYGGSGGSGSVRVTYGANFPSAVAPGKVGYTFGGYYSEADGAGIQYLDAQMLPVNLSRIGEDGARVYAHWLPNANTLIISPNGGVGAVVYVDTATDAVFSTAGCAFTRAGYTLKGWNTRADGTGVFCAAGGDFTVPPSDTQVYLYADWQAKPVTVSFNGNGGTAGETASVQSESDGVITLPACGFIRRGYAFAGWGATAEGGQVFPASGSYTVPVTDTGAAELYARWKLEVYEITYNLGGGENAKGNPAEYTVLSGEIVLAEPFKLGYNFKGWGGGNVIPAESVGNRTFTAQWDVIRYNIIYIWNVSGAIKNLEDHPKTYTVEEEVRLIDPEYGDRKFLGWTEGDIIYKGSTGDKTFTANWDITTYSITYLLEGGENGAGNAGSFTAETGAISLNKPVKAGYKFTGWTCEELGIVTPSVTAVIPGGTAKDLTFTAHWGIETYCIAYVLNGGENSEENPLTYTVLDDDIFLDDPSRFGYLFDGWAEGGVIESGSTGDLTFTAAWTPVKYSVTVFDGVNDAEPPSYAYTIESGDLIITAAGDAEYGADYTVTIDGVTTRYALERAGYRLLGFYEGEDSSAVKITTLIPSGSTGIRVLISLWEIIDYSITYDAGEGGVNDENNPSTYNVTSEAITFFAPVREGYTFVCWEDASGDAVTGIPAGSRGDVSLTARWSATEYTITYLPDGGDMPEEDYPRTYTAESETLVLPTPVKDGFEFVRWEDENGAAVADIPHGSTGDKTLTAVWRPALPEVPELPDISDPS